MRRVRLVFASGVEVEFTDRDVALRWLKEVATRGTRFPVIIYGPEGCGKTALLRQAVEVLEEYGYRTVYVSPLEDELSRALRVSPSIRDVALEVLRSVNEPLSNLVHVAFKIKELVEERFEKPRIALLFDDLFQAVGLGYAERYVKKLLNMIEYPSRRYESIVVLVSSSESLTRERIGRHDWAEMYMLWNMSWDGFRQLYHKLPGEKPPVDVVWRLTGGNPRVLAKLYEVGWNADILVEAVIEGKGLRELLLQLRERGRRILEEALEDPDTLLLKGDEARELLEKLVELNLVAKVPARRRHLWVDIPPPERDSILGVGRYVAWQTPLHREAVRKALAETEVRTQS